MKTHFIITKKEKSLKLLIAQILIKWASNYIEAMSKALYPPETREVKSKNDIHRMFHK
ncbi:hypothetical protein [Aquimarina algicola]|uniref:hypothetical protein n=1 Tax=Aquimarina algicola TaxID=2589995 RepID=UPI001CF32770|nr:hypothetical protein [Aquimarina algicola]